MQAVNLEAQKRRALSRIKAMVTLNNSPAPIESKPNVEIKARKQQQF